MGLGSSTEYNFYLEDSFDVMFEPEEIMELTSYGKGIEILNRYGIDLKL